MEEGPRSEHCSGQEDPPSQAAPPAKGGGVLTVTKQEWGQIEDVPVHTRAVGQLFQETGKPLQGSSAGRPPPGENRDRRPFDRRAYLHLQGEQPEEKQQACSVRGRRGRGGGSVGGTGPSIQDKTSWAFLDKDRAHVRNPASNRKDRLVPLQK
jgi:hypothetical protein